MLLKVTCKPISWEAIKPPTLWPQLDCFHLLNCSLLLTSPKHLGLGIGCLIGQVFHILETGKYTGGREGMSVNMKDPTVSGLENQECKTESQIQTSLLTVLKLTARDSHQDSWAITNPI